MKPVGKKGAVGVNVTLLDYSMNLVGSSAQKRTNEAKIKDYLLKMLKDCF